MERAVVMVHKLTDAEVERLCCRYDSIKQEAAAEDRVQGDESSFGRLLGKIYIKSEVPDAEPEAVTVKDAPIDWHEEPQASSSSGSHAVTFKREVESDCHEACSKLREGSSGGCNTSAFRQGPAGPSLRSADSLPSDVSVSVSGLDAAPPDRLMSRSLLCEHCDYSTGRSRKKRRSLMKLHLRVRHKLGCYYECELCDFSTMYMRNLKLHLSGKRCKGRLFKCEFCDYSSAHWNRVAAHLASKHGRGQLFKCDFCDYSSAERSNVKLHRTRKHGIGQLFKCEFCDYVSALTVRVREHKASKHGKGKLFKCEICDYASARTSRVREHLASKHGKGQLFKCEFCDYFSALKSNVKLHRARKHSCNNSLPF